MKKSNKKSDRTKKSDMAGSGKSDVWVMDNSSGLYVSNNKKSDRISSVMQVCGRGAFGKKTWRCKDSITCRPHMQ